VESNLRRRRIRILDEKWEERWEIRRGGEGIAEAIWDDLSILLVQRAGSVAVEISSPLISQGKAGRMMCLEQIQRTIGRVVRLCVGPLGH
jgi:hypothetical protein